MDTALFKKLVRFYLIHSSQLKPGKFSARGDRLWPVESHMNQEVKCVLVTAAKAIAAQESPVTVSETCITDARSKAALLLNSAECTTSFLVQHAKHSNGPFPTSHTTRGWDVSNM